MRMTEYGKFSDSDGHMRHQMSVPVYYEDTDFSGFVYHANYVKFAERGRSNFLKLCDISHTELLALDPQLAFVFGHMEMDFLVPARVDDVLLVETAFTEMRGARLVAEQRILRQGETVWQAHVLAACVDLEGRPRRLPRSVSDKLAPHIGGPFLSSV